jgi:hypothetical protein
VHVQRRLVLEHDDLRFSAADVLRLHEQTGVRLIFDHQHFWCMNPERLEYTGRFTGDPEDLARRRAPENTLLQPAHRAARDHWIFCEQS